MNTILFDGKRSLDVDQACVSYDAIVDGKKIPCAISRDALQYWFEDMGDPLATFDSNRLTILYFTRRAIDECGCRDGERVLIKQQDLMRGA